MFPYCVHRAAEVPKTPQKALDGVETEKKKKDQVGALVGNHQYDATQGPAGGAVSPLSYK